MERQRYKGTHKGTWGGVGEEDRWGVAENEHSIPLWRVRKGEADGNRKEKADTVHWS